MRFDSTKKFYKDLEITTNLQLKAITEDIVLKTLTLPKQQVLIIFQEDKGAVTLAKLVTKIFKLFIKLGILPDPCKLAKLKPIFKKGSRINPSNYRPT